MKLNKSNTEKSKNICVTCTFCKAEYRTEMSKKVKSEDIVSTIISIFVAPCSVCGKSEFEKYQEKGRLAKIFFLIMRVKEVVTTSRFLTKK